MEVTKSNFDSVFPEIVQDIQSATFVCIDGEFTGLRNGHNTTAFDTPAEYYHKIKTGSMDFLLVQLGLSIFTQDETTGKYRNKTYAFYLFPSHRLSLAPDTRFLCQTSSIQFLVNNNFDFNKLFKEGIPYLNLADESALVEAMETRRSYQANQLRESSQRIPIPKQHKLTLDSVMEMIDKVVSGSESKVDLGKHTSFVRKLIYQTYEERYGNTGGVVLKTNNGAMTCLKGEEEDRESRDSKEIKAAVGFSRVVRELSAKGCLVVGHNMLLDVCHLVQSFMDPLPDEYQEFKEMLHTLFPRIVDTKHISAEEPLKSLLSNTTLEALMEVVSKPPFHLPEIEEVEGYSFSGENNQYHDAGYDALVTGKIFLSFVHCLDSNNKMCSIQNCKPLKKYINKLHIMKTPDTYIDLVNADPVPLRDHVFHISFPSSWNSHNIAKLFSPFGSVQLFWLSSTSAWVSLIQREEANKAREALEDSRSLPFGVTIISYHRYMKEKGAATSPRPNKRKSEGSDSLIDEKKRRSSNIETSRNGSTKRISPIPEEKLPESKENELKMLEEAASFDGGAFDANSSWD